MAIKLEDFIPKGTNIFGARTPTYLEGLITPEQMKQAQQQSLFQGLLGTAVGYLAQPKNQRYGSAIPYLAKAYGQGMQMAQTPYSNLERDILMKEKFDQMRIEKQRQEDLKNLQSNLYTKTPAETITTSDYMPIIKTGADASVQIAPSFAPYNVQETTIVPEQNKLNTAALQEYIAKYPEQGLKYAQALEGINKLGMPTTSRVLTPEEVRSGVYGNLNPEGVYQISPTGAISTVQSAEKPINYGTEANLAATERGYPTFNDAPDNVKREIAKELKLSDKEKAALMGGITSPQFGTSGQTEIDKQFLTNAAELQRYDSIAKQFSPSYMTWETQAKAGALALAEKAGRTLTPQEANLVTGYTQFKTSTLQQLNDYIVKITGAAIGQGEEEKRLKASVPNADDSATQFKAKLDLLTKDVKKAQARLYYLKTKGYKNLEQGFKDIKLDDMPQIMAQREKELIEQYAKGKNLDENPQIKGAIARQLAAEFGLSY